MSHHTLGKAVPLLCGAYDMYKFIHFLCQKWRELDVQVHALTDLLSSNDSEALMGQEVVWTLLEPVLLLWQEDETFLPLPGI